MWRHDYPEFAIETMRLRSFEDWPKMMKQKPDVMSDAGFFYTQISDRVICFSCGGGLCKWDEKDDPWEQHALWYSKCKYLLLMKGPEYVAATNEKYGPAQSEKNTGNAPSFSSLFKFERTNGNKKSNDCNASSSKKQEEKKTRKIDDSKLCRICFVNEYNTIFLPCGHIVACAKCAAAQNKCPICREKFESISRIFLP